MLWPFEDGAWGSTASPWTGVMKTDVVLITARGAWSGPPLPGLPLCPLLPMDAHLFTAELHTLMLLAT